MRSRGTGNEAFLEFEINEIESAQLRPGEDEELETLYRKLNNGKKFLRLFRASVI